MAKKEEKKGIMDLLLSKKWVELVEKTVEKRLKLARSSFDKSLQKAIKSLNITTRKDLNNINRRIKALEKRMDRLEGVVKIATPKGSKQKEV